MCKTYDMKNMYLHKNCDLEITYSQMDFICFYIKTRIKNILIFDIR